MEKRWNIQFPISFFSFLCPSNTGDFGRFSLQTECLSYFDKEETIILNSLEDTIKTENIITFLLFQSHRMTLLFPLFPSRVRSAIVHFPPSKFLNGSMTETESKLFAF